MDVESAVVSVSVSAIGNGTVSTSSAATGATFIASGGAVRSVVVVEEVGGVAAARQPRRPIRRVRDDVRIGWKALWQGDCRRVGNLLGAFFAVAAAL